MAIFKIINRALTESGVSYNPNDNISVLSSPTSDEISNVRQNFPFISNNLSESTGFNNPLSQFTQNTPQSLGNINRSDFINGPLDNFFDSNQSIIPEMQNNIRAVQENFLGRRNFIKDKDDTRVTLRYKRNFPGVKYPGILAPLSKTNGLVFPYRPTINISTSVNYETISLVHSLQEQYAFTSNNSPTISLTGEFTCQNVDEAMYSLASIHFLRSASKMVFGKETSTLLAGTPPPILEFSAYGDKMINALPVIITGFSQDLPTDVDYVQYLGNTLPTKFSISISLAVLNVPEKLREFNLEDFRRGRNIKGFY